MTHLLRRGTIHTEVYGKQRGQIAAVTSVTGGLWIDVGTTYTDSPPFLGGWMNVGGTLQPLRFCWTMEGGLEIEGSITGGVLGTQVFQLPGWGMIATSALHSGGSGYYADDKMIVNGGNSDAVIVIDTVQGPVDSFAVTNQGTGYSPATNVSVSGGSGSSLTIDINAVDAMGHIVAAAVNTAGTNYLVGDVFTIPGGDGMATGQVVLNHGTVLPFSSNGYHVVSGGSGYSLGSNIATTLQQPAKTYSPTPPHTVTPGSGFTVDVGTLGYDDHYIPDAELRFPASDALGNYLVLRALPDGRVIGGV